jgi:UDP-N-acetylmuramoylalanine--D-glutamate ligase
MEDYRGRHILVFGLARSGLAAVRLLAGRGAKVCGADEDEKIEIPPDLTSIETHLGPFRAEMLDGIDMVVVSPGIALGHPLFTAASAKNLDVIGELELAFRNSDSPVIAVTGTNGKSTTVAMIGAILNEDGRGAVVAGNTGTPFSSVVGEAEEGKIFVIEVSSFQLETTAWFHPACAGILNMTPDHLDRYENSEDYYDAKRRIIENLSPDDHFFYNADDNLCRQVAGATVAIPLPFSLSGRVPGGVYLDGGHLIKEKRDGTEEIICDRNEIQVVGDHNVENALAAIAAVTPFDVPADSCHRALASFEGLPHRMEPVAESGGIAYFNDSKATNVDATVKSLAGLKSPVILIAGGYDKGGDYSRLLEISGVVRAIVTIGAAAGQIEEAVASEIRCVRASSMDEAVRRASDMAEAGWQVILSPACASFDMFDDFEHRGKVFRECVAELLRGKGADGE